MTLTRADLRALARDEGFGLDRIASLGPTPHADTVATWLDNGQHGDMAWMERTREVRLDPRTRSGGAGSVWMLGVQHIAQLPPDPGGRTGRVARYAWGRDYHNALRKPLRRLRTALEAHGVTAWGGTDAEPLVERAWATAAGLGFTGKSCVQIIPHGGTYWRLAALVLDTDFPPDEPLHTDLCGKCTRCLVACPTQAFIGPRNLDARRCISYWTIEVPELAPRALRSKFGRWILGCDVCQEVCPHNTVPRGLVDTDTSHAWLDLDEILATSDQGLLDRFEGTAIRRPGAAGLKRNALVALGNLGDPGAVDSCRHALAHTEPVVRQAAVWALARLGEPGHGLQDPDPNVRDEAEASYHTATGDEP